MNNNCSKGTLADTGTTSITNVVVDLNESSLFILNKGINLTRFDALGVEAALTTYRRVDDGFYSNAVNSRVEGVKFFIMGKGTHTFADFTPGTSSGVYG